MADAGTQAPPSESAATEGTRQVAQVTRHPQPMEFRALCEQVLPPETRYLLLDLDRTVHLGINMGEMLGWELGAWNFYGPEQLDELEAARGHGRFVADWSRPLVTAHYTYEGVRLWGRPGLGWLVWGKLAPRVPWLRQLGERRMGDNPLRVAQQAVQQNLMALLEAESHKLTLQLAERVWRRHVGRQVITRQDVDWIRARCPQVEIILTSASPRASVEVTARELGITTHVFSTPERINSGQAKIDYLKQLRPELLAEGVVSAGISDSQYGEDHCWGNYLTVVADINSTWPFPERVRADSPLRAVHSAQVLTQEELRRRAAGDADYLDPRRADLMRKA